MAKDPAFLFYAKDWLEGTAEMTCLEKGVYIDLLAHQHQKGSIPADTTTLARLVRLPEDPFLPVWNALKSKFLFLSDPTIDHLVDRSVDRSVDRLVNRKLLEVMTERSTKGHTNRIIGRFAVLMRSVPKKSTELRAWLKEKFQIEDFLPFSTEEATERVTVWFTERLTERSLFGIPNLANANANKNKRVEGLLGEGGEKEPTPTSSPPVQTDDNNLIYDIETELLNNRIALEAILMKTRTTEEKGLEVLKIYHLSCLEKQIYPTAKVALFAGFEKYLRNEKKIFAHGKGNHTSKIVGREIQRDKP